MNINSDINNSIGEALSNIQFLDIFSLEEIQHLQDLFSNAFGVASIITHPDGIPITKPSNFSRLCNNIIRTTKIGCANCYKSDALVGRYNPSGPIIQPCLSGGLWDAGASILVGDKHIANWLIGQVRNEKIDKEFMLQYADEIGANRVDFMEALDEVTVMSVEQFNKISEMLFAYANELSDKAFNNLSLKLQIKERMRVEDELIQHQLLLSTIIESTSEAIFAKDADGKYQSINQAGASMIGYSVSDVIGKTDMELLPAEIAGEFRTTDEYVMTSGRLMEREETGMFAGKARTFLTHKSPWRDSNGKIIGVIGLSTDITHRKQVEEALEQSNTIMKNTQSMAKIGGWEWNIDNNVMYWTDETYLIHDFVPGEIRPSAETHIAKSMDCYRPEDRMLVMEAFQRCVTTGESYDLVFPFTTFNGRHLWIRTSAQAEWDGNKIKKIFGTINDITDRKLAEEELQKSELRLHTLIDTIPDLIWLKNSDGVYLKCNQRFETLFGKKEADIVGKTDFDFIDMELALFFQEKDKQAIEAGKSIVNEETLTFFDGHTEILETIKTPIYELDGKILGVLGIGRNITERKQAELLLQQKNDEIRAHNEEYMQINEELIQTNKELYIAKEHAEESDRLKTAFLQNMSHEIRTPMNAIVGFSGLLVENYNNKQKLEYFSEIINQRCNDLLDIINDILDIAKIESGQLTVNIENCNLSELFSELTAFFTEHHKRLGKQQIMFRLQALCTPYDIVIATDKVKLKQIFINLIGNAFKFTNTGKIEGGCKFDNNQHLVFFVSDTGIGIPKDKFDSVFERFSQLGHKSNLAYGGTGLGLSIVKGLVGLLDGKIWIESELNKGTTFYFSIPYITKLSEPAKPATIEDTSAYQFLGKTILLVEDDPYNTAFLREILSSTGFEIKYTDTGKDAIRQVLTHSIDIILLDIRLPDIDGFEVSRQIKELKPKIKIIAQTAYAAPEDRQKAASAGCIDYISKPLDRNLLLSMLRKYLTKN